MKSQQGNDTAFFQKKLVEYDKLIDKDIALYVENVQRSTLKKYGKNSREASDAYLEVLARGGKHIRGALVMCGYEMLGGSDTKMIVQAARALEMIHTYLLIIDDINDRSATRRGGPSAHKLIAQKHQAHKLLGDSEHFGESIAMNAALVGSHSAQTLLANLDVESDILIKALSVLNDALITTAHGQFNDLYNEVNPSVSDQDVMNVMEWKTAYYTFLNPLTFGMVLAGADYGSTDAIAPYALNAGLAFQLTDDILGTFGTEFESGKSPMDDMREGKRTLLVNYALKHADAGDVKFLQSMLGNQKLTKTEFKRCQNIIESSGALVSARTQAEKLVEQAIDALDKTRKYWNDEGVKFLTGLSQYLLERNS